MRSDFCPHDRDQTTQSMEGSLLGFGPLWKGCWAAKRMDFFWATRLTVGVSNDLQMARNLTGGLPVLYQGHFARLGPFRERLTPAHENRQEGCAGACGSVGLRNGQRGNARMHEMNTYANEMHVMT